MTYITAKIQKNVDESQGEKIENIEALSNPNSINFFKNLYK